MSMKVSSAGGFFFLESSMICLNVRICKTLVGLGLKLFWLIFNLGSRTSHLLENVIQLYCLALIHIRWYSCNYLFLIDIPSWRLLHSLRTMSSSLQFLKISGRMLFKPGLLYASKPSLWSCMHHQYSGFWMSSVFWLPSVFGAFRIRLLMWVNKNETLYTRLALKTRPFSSLSLSWIPHLWFSMSQCIVLYSVGFRSCPCFLWSHLFLWYHFL